MKIIQHILAASCLLIIVSVPARATIYNINFNGSIVDLSSFIETDAVGTFSPTNFDSLVLNYSILGSWNGANPFTFTKANSTWGGGFLGSNVAISILGGVIQLSAPMGFDFDGGNVFLIVDNPLPDGIIPNLRIAQNHFGLRSDPDTMVFETVPTTFTLAKVPEPGSIPLLAAGLGLIAFSRVAKRRRRSHQ